MSNESGSFGVCASKIFAAAVLLASISLHIDAQPAASEVIQVTVVEVPVTVADRAGNSVRGLSIDNFELFDQGDKRTIAYFETIDLARVSAAEPGSQPLNPAARRNFTLLFDLTSTAPQHLGRAREAAGQFVTTGMERQDLAAVVTYSVERGFRFLTTFTTDRSLLKTAIDSVGAPRMYQTSDPLLLLPTMTETGMKASPSSGREAAVEEEIREAGRIIQSSNEEYRRQRVARQLRSFSMFARTLDRLRGRKQVILLSEGFDAKLVLGRENISSEEARAESAASVSGEIWKIDSDARFGNTAASTLLKAMFEYFKRSDVVIHAVDVQGLRSNVNARSGAISPSTESLFLMSNGTGGQLFKNSNDLSNGFERLMRQQEVIYVLGFRAPTGKDPRRFRNLKVRLVNAPAGSRAFHRAGYYEASPMSPLEQTLSATEIMMNDIEQTDVGIHVVSSPFPLADSENQVPVVVEIDGPSLMAGVPANTLNGELFIYAFDEQNSVKDFLYQRMTLDLEKMRPALGKGGVKYYGTLALRPGTYQLRTLLRVHESNRNGYKRTALKVPDFDTATALPPFFWEQGRSWVMLKGVSRVKGTIEYPFNIGDESFVPSAQPQLRNDNSYKVALFTYNLAPDAIELIAKVRGSNGSEQNAGLSLVGRVPAGPKGSTKLLFNFTPVGLAAGQYTLEFAVKQKGDAAGQTVSTPFVLN